MRQFGLDRRGQKPELQYRHKSFLGRLKDKATRDFFENAVRTFLGYRAECPPWMLRVEEKHLQGIDFVLYTDVGEINVQIESSPGWARKYVREHAGDTLDVVIIVFDENEAPLELFRRMRAIVAQSRQRILRGERKKFLVSEPNLTKPAP